uniref:E3 ubiquitin-protein ligase listerin n=1 Tax=Heterorhabditis bacteriophora TaxID=37862 RepID=A0A1I7WXS9_HETBA
MTSLCFRDKKYCEYFTVSAEVSMAKCVRELVFTLMKTDFSKYIDDSTLKYLEKCVGNDSIASISDYICSSRSISYLVEVLLQWTNSGLSVRLLLKLRTLFTFITLSSSSCFDFLSSSSLLDVLDGIVLLLQTDITGAQLSCLLDVFTSALSTAKSLTTWTDVGIKPSEIEVRIDMIARRLILCAYIDAIFTLSVTTLREGTTFDSTKTYTSELISVASVAIDILKFVRSDKLAWKSILSCPVRAFCIFLVLSEVVRNGVRAISEGYCDGIENIHDAIRIIGHFAAAGSNCQSSKYLSSLSMTICHLLDNFRISRKNDICLEAMKSSIHFRTSAASRKRCSARQFCIDRNKW